MDDVNARFQQLVTMLQQALDRERATGVQAADMAQQVAALQAEAARAAAAGTPVPGTAPPMPPPQYRPESMVDTRVLGKPRSLTGKDEDWNSWVTIFRAYSGAVDQRLLGDMDAAELSVVPLPQAAMTPRTKQRSAQL